MNFPFLKAIKKHQATRSFISLTALLLVALLANILAHEPRPNDLFPPFIPFAPTTQIGDYYAAPSIAAKHYLGTHDVGRDVAAGLIHGTRTALIIGVGGMLVALFIGLPIGLMAGFYGDNRMEISILRLILRGGYALILAYFFYVSIRHGQDSLGFVLVKIAGFIVFIELVINILSNFLKKMTPSVFKAKIYLKLPFDLLTMRGIELIQAIPLMLWIIGALTIFGAQKLTVGQIVLLIGLTSWINFAQLARGEMLRIRSLEFMEAAEAIGMSAHRQMLRHALPNIISPLLVSFSFGIAGGILLESSLSVIGLGLPIEQVTWGVLLNQTREHFECWWLAVFPGAAIFLAIYTFNRLGEFLKKAV